MLSTWNQQARANKITWTCLAAVLVFFAVLRFGLLDVPLERDEGEYAYAGQLILQGVPPYKQVFNMKLPGIYGFYALLIALFGETHQGIHTGLLVINALTTVLVFLLARWLAGNPGALLAAAFFALLSLSSSVQGVQANAEHFVIAFVMAGLVLLRHSLRTGRWWQFFTTGVVFGLAVTMKQHAIAFCLLAVLCILGAGLLHPPVQWRKVIMQLTWFAGGVMFVMAILFLLMLATGVFEQFWFWTVEYALTYISSIPLDQGLNNFTRSATQVFANAPLIWLLSVVGLCLLVGRVVSRHARLFLILLALCSFLSICPGLFFRPHYFILLLPAAAILAGFSLSTLATLLARYMQGNKNIILLLLLGCASLGQSIYGQQDYLFKLSPFAVSRMLYQVNPFPETLRIANYIRQHTETEDRLAVIGSEPQLFFYTNRKAASGYIYMYPLMENHAFALEMQKDFIREVEKNNPKFVVFLNLPTTWLKGPKSHPNLLDWFNGYSKDKLQLVGTVEMGKDKSTYHWQPKVKWPLNSPFYILIFKRKN